MSAAQVEPVLDALSGGDPTVEEYLEKWLAHVRGRVRAITWESYQSLIRVHVIPQLGTIRLAALRPLHLQALYSDAMAGTPDKRALSAGSTVNLHLVLTQALGQATRWQLLPTNPATGAQPPRPRRPALQIPDLPLLQHLLRELRGHPLELPVAIAIATGMRRGEILALRWSDIDANDRAAHIQRTLHATKNGLVFDRPKTARSQRSVLLPRFLRPYLQQQRQKQAAQREDDPQPLLTDHGLVIARADGSPVNPDSLSSAWRRFLKQQRLPQRVRFHDLRHAHASLMLSKGIHPKIVSERLGHASVGITLDTYSHVLPSMQNEAVKAFDQLLG